MDTYHVEWSHTPEECHRLLEETKYKGSHMLDKFYWSCESGLHMGWGFLEAGSEEDLRRMLPDSMHSGMKYHRVRRFSDLAAGIDADRGLHGGLGRDFHGDLNPDLHGRRDDLGMKPDRTFGADKDFDRGKDVDRDKDIDREKEGQEIRNYEDFRPKKSA